MGSDGARSDAPRGDDRVLVLAPLGRDAHVLCDALARIGIAAVTCNDMAELGRQLHSGAGVVLLTEEALAPAAVSTLANQLDTQAPWSDVPMVLLTGGEPHVSDSAAAIATLRATGNLTVLQRPVRGLTLLTALQAALRARRRQYEVRDLVESERAARREAEAARLAAEAATRLKDEFLATVSHELRTPLGAILLWTRLLARGRLERDEIQHGLHAVERSAEMQSKLIEDLLDVSRMTSGKLLLAFEDADLAAIARAAIDVVRPAADAKNVRVAVALETQGSLVRADPDRMQQVVWNLLSNAVKFTPAGGTVSVRLRRDQGGATIEVADTGKGISAEFLPYVFDRFRQADVTAQRRQGGLGIGLAITRQLVELHGGTIYVDSAGEDQGAVFVVKLPLVAGAVAEASPAGGPGPTSEPPSQSSLGGIRVLLAEDDPDTREAIAQTLRKCGARVTAVESGPGALEALSAAAPGERPQVLLSDVGLPGMDGYALMREIRLREKTGGEPALPAAAITAYARSADRNRAREAGFALHLSKPVEPEELTAAVEQLARTAR